MGGIAQLVKDGRYAEQQSHKEFMQNSEWQKNFVIFSKLTDRSFRDKFITGLIITFPNF
jgi:hypothetical protein